MGGKHTETGTDFEQPRAGAGPRAPGSAANAPRHLRIRIGADGTWYYLGTPIRRMEMVRLFASVLRRDADGRFWMVTPAERGLVDVDDAPFAAVELTYHPGAAPDGRDDRIDFRTNLDDRVACGAGRPLRVEIDGDTDRPSPYVMVRDGLEARLTRSVFLELADLARERVINGKRVLGVWSRDAFFVLGPAETEC